MTAPRDGVEARRSQVAAVQRLRVDAIAKACVWLTLAGCEARQVSEDGPVEAILGEGIGMMCANLESGETKCWGTNVLDYYDVGVVDGYVGDDERLVDLPPVPFGGKLLGLRTNATGARACARLEGSRLQCWGFAGQYPSMLPGGADLELTASEPVVIEGLTDVSLGRSQGCLVVSGGVHCWGQDEFGVVGGPSISFDELLEQLSEGAPPIDLGQDVVAVGAGIYTSCALTSKGDVFCWGSFIDTGYTDPDLGDVVGDDEILRDVGPLPLGMAMTRISVGMSGFICALSDMGEVACWGWEVPAEDAERTSVSASFVEISTNGSQVCAITADHELYCWGRNDFGAVGTGTVDSVPASSPALIDLGEPIAEVETILGGTCARSMRGRVKCWGSAWSDEVIGDDEPASAAPWLEF